MCQSKKEDVKHLEFIYSRLSEVHGEKHLVDYMTRFREIIYSMEKSPKPEYSREFEIIPPDEMARLMVAGEVLELHSKDKIAYKHGRFYYENGENFNCWAVKSRVATKAEKRWQWLCQSMNGKECVCTQGYYPTKEEAMDSLTKGVWTVLRKIEESAEEFEIGAE
jgi:hypothetical protein